MTINDLRAIVGCITCEVGDTPWNVFVGQMGNGYYIQLRYIETDIETDDLSDQHSRKWYISPHSLESEVVQTVLKACLTSAEHMIREHFTYCGQRVFSPHFDIMDLVKLSKEKKRVARPPAGV